MSDRGKKSFFAVVEGVDRVGKSTVAAALVERMRSGGRAALLFSTPDYRLPTGGIIRGLLESTGIGGSAHEAAALQSLMIVNRYEVAEQIRSALESGFAVVCVRWWPSSVLYAYLDANGTVVDARAACSFLPEPDLYLLIDPGEEISARLDPAERYEADPAAQRGLAASYRDLWDRRSRSDPRWARVVCEGDVCRVVGRAWEIVGTAMAEELR